MKIRPGITTVLLVAAILITTAGCTKSSHEQNVFVTPGVWDIPPAYHGNPWAPGGVGVAGSYVHEPLFVYVPTTKEWIPRLATSFHESEDHKTLTVKLQPDAYWHDDMKFTSHDVRTTFYIGYLKNMEIWWTLEDIECPDDHTVVFKWKTVSPINSIRALTERITSPYHIFGKWADRIPQIREDLRENTANDPEKRKQLNKMMADVREVLYKYHPALPIGTGPFKVDRVSASDLTMNKFAKHYAAENVKFDKCRIVRWGSNEVVWSYLMAGEVDAATPATPYDVAQQILKRNPGMKMVTPPDMSDFGLIFNCKKEPVSDLKFRQAVAHIIDRDMVRKVAYTYADTVYNYSLGIPRSFEKEWLDENFYKDLTVYDHNHEKAKNILHDAGYRINTQTQLWEMPGGKPISLEIIAPTGLNDLILLAEASAAQLTKFGIKAQVRTVPLDLYITIITAGNYHLAAENGSQLNKFGHPSISYNRFYRQDGLIQTASAFPAEIKYKDGNTVNVDELAKELNSCMDEDRLKEIVRTLAWITNENLPYLTCYEKKIVVFTLDGKRIEDFPDQNDPAWGAAPGGIENLYCTFIVQGKVRPMRRQ